VKWTMFGRGGWGAIKSVWILVSQHVGLLRHDTAALGI